MFWRKLVPISENMCRIFSPIIAVVRLFGLLPVRIRSNGKQRYLQPSPIYLLYSFAFGVTIIYLTYAGLLEDISVGNAKSIRIKTKSDAFITFIDISAVVSVAFWGIFITPFKNSAFCNYIECLNKIDAIIPLVNVKSVGRRSVIAMVAILGTTTILIILDTLVHFNTAGEMSSKAFILRLYTPFYIAYIVMMANQFLFWFFVNCITRRIEALNVHLHADNFKNLLKKDSAEVSKGSRKSQLERLNIFNVNQNSSQNYKTMIHSNFIFKLMAVYITLSDAVQYLNRLFGLTCAVTIVGILWHLIESPYWLIMELLGQRKNIEYISMNAAWCFYHIGRLALLAHPCHACRLEVQKTNNLICTLLSSEDINQHYKSQLKDFSVALFHRKFEFNAGGLATIDLSLMTSVIGAITTYLVILIQFATSTKSLA